MDKQYESLRLRALCLLSLLEGASVRHQILQYKTQLNSLSTKAMMLAGRRFCCGDAGTPQPSAPEWPCQRGRRLASWGASSSVFEMSSRPRSGRAPGATVFWARWRRWCRERHGLIALSLPIQDQLKGCSAALSTRPGCGGMRKTHSNAYVLVAFSNLFMAWYELPGRPCLEEWCAHLEPAASQLVDVKPPNRQFGLAYAPSMFQLFINDKAGPGVLLQRSLSKGSFVDVIGMAPHFDGEQGSPAVGQRDVSSDICRCPPPTHYRLHLMAR